MQVGDASVVVVIDVSVVNVVIVVETKVWMIGDLASYLLNKYSMTSP